MKIPEYIAAQSICLAEHNRLTAWLTRAQTAVHPRLLARVLTSNDDDDTADDADSLGEDMMAAIYPPRPRMVVNELAGVAIIPVMGMITQGLSVFEQRYFGCCDVDDIGDMVDSAAANPTVRKTVFNFDSPGGYLGGGPELADKIGRLTAQMKTVAFTRGMMCSQAYLFGSQCGTIAVTRSSIMGSIGTYTSFVDMSEMAKEMGIRVQVFASGKFKGAGTPGTSLTAEQATLVQEQINKRATQFKNYVLAARPGIPESAMEGQTFYGDECMELNLCDDLVDDLSDIVP